MNRKRATLMAALVASHFLTALVFYSMRPSAMVGSSSSPNQPKEWKASDEVIGEVYAWSMDSEAAQRNSVRTGLAISQLETLVESSLIQGAILTQDLIAKIPFRQATALRILTKSVDFEWAFSDSETERCIVLTFSIPEWRLERCVGITPKRTPKRSLP